MIFVDDLDLKNNFYLNQIQFFFFFYKYLKGMLADEVQEALLIGRNPDNIRNITIMPHRHQISPTLFDLLEAGYGVKEEQAINQKSHQTGQKIAAILSYNVPQQHQQQIQSMSPHLKSCLINLVHPPAISKLDAGIAAECNLADSVVFVIDLMDGLGLATENALRKVLQHNLYPIFFIDNLDISLNDQNVKLQQISKTIVLLLAKIRSVVAGYKVQKNKIPLEDHVFLGSVKNNWCFGFSDYFVFTTMQKFGVKDEQVKQIINDLFEGKGKEKEGQTNKNKIFIQQILVPLQALATKNFQKIKNMGLEKLKTQQNQSYLSNWLPLPETLMLYFMAYCPSPKQAQSQNYRNLIYPNSSDKTGQFVQNCDPANPLVVYCAKVVQVQQSFITIGRILSGTFKANSSVYLLGPQPQENKGKNIMITKCFIPTTRNRIYPVEQAYCGSIVGLTNCSEHFNKCLSLFSNEIQIAHPLRGIDFQLHLIVQIYLTPRQVIQLPQMLDGIKNLLKCNPALGCQFQESGQNFLRAVSQAHLEACVDDLQKKFLTIEIDKSEIFPVYQESILEDCKDYLLAKGPNKFNRLYGTSQKLNNTLVEDIENGKIVTSFFDSKEMKRKLVSDYTWNNDQFNEIWSFGPKNIGPNVLVDCTKQVWNLNQIKDSIITSFNFMTSAGALCQERLRGVRYNIIDAVLHPDSIHRGPGQIIPASRRLFTALQIKSEPCLLEPMIRFRIRTPQALIGLIYMLLNQKYGTVLDQVIIPVTPETILVVGEIPIKQSYSIVSEVYTRTNGRATIQTMFTNDWNQTKNPYEVEKARDLVLQIRKRKGMKLQLPNLTDYADKL